MSTLAWYTTRHFPWHSDHPAGCGNDALIGVGGNIGDTLGRFERLFAYWQQSRELRIIQSSPILRNPPFGYTQQPDFYNALLWVRTPLDPHALLRYILWTEKRFGRKRSFPNAPRTLDLDLIFYDHQRVRTRRLHLPHPHWHERDSVVMPWQHMKGTPW